MTGEPFNDDQIRAGRNLIDALAEAHGLAPDRDAFYAVVDQLDLDQLRAIAVAAVVDRIEQVAIDAARHRARDEWRRRHGARWTRETRHGRRGGGVDG